MNNVNLIAQVCMYNEVEKGNLERCLENLRRYCNSIVIYDDASTDNSVEVASRYTDHIIRGEVNNQLYELRHKQMILEKSLELGATHLFWLDCDEVLDMQGTMGGLRALCEKWPKGLQAISFKEINLWRSQTWARRDTQFEKARFVRLWKVEPGICFNIKKGVHLQLYPMTIRAISEGPFGVIHYGFWNYKKMMVKIGAHLFNKEELHKCAETNWILDERKCDCYRLPNDKYPPGCLPPDIWDKPQPKSIESLIPYNEVPEEKPYPFVDSRGINEWNKIHEGKYHGTYDSILKRNRHMWNNQPMKYSTVNLFSFSPANKVVCDMGSGGGWHTIECIVKGATKVYSIEINANLINMAKDSFKELGIPEDKYEFVYAGNGTVDSIPKVDLIFCIAVFQHIPFWQARAWFRWIASQLKDDGEAYLQFHQKNNICTFWNQQENITIGCIESVLEKSGLKIESRRLMEGKGVLPVWYEYRCTRKNV